MKTGSLKNYPREYDNAHINISLFFQKYYILIEPNIDQWSHAFMLSTTYT